MAANSETNSDTEIAECTVAPVAMADSDHEAHSSSDEQDSCPASPNHSRDRDAEQHSSHSDDSEVENIMQDPHHQGGHHDDKHHHHHGHEPHDADGEAEGEDRPHTPSYLRPPVAGRAQSDSGSDPSLPQSRSVEFDLSSPISPTRPKSPWGRFDPYNNNEDQDKEYVGFATLPNQVHRKSVKKGFDFTLMVAGESGLGKSTLVNSLFLTDLYKDRKLLNAEGEEAAAFDIRFRFSLNKYLPFNISWLILKTMVCLCPLPIERITQTVEITKHTVDIEEKGVKLKLTIVDTPGFGDAVNNTECWKSVADYIDQQFEQYFRDESGLNRKNIQDNRVHCCLYFISPFGHGLRPLDVEFMKALHEKVNIVPILAKADTLTPSEVKKKKIKIREEIEQYGIKIYQFPDCDSDEDEDFKQQDTELKESIPFAVIGSNTVVEAKGKRVRGRLYPWGIVEVENSAHCDFVKLRNMLVRTHMQDLKDVTRETHYENYRAHCIQSMTRMVVKERNRNKLTRESGTDFPIPVVPAVADSETEKLIREKDEEVRHVDHELDSHQQHDHKHDSEHSSDHHEHSDPQPNAETRSDLKGDEAL
ncbi:septin 4b isoform X3 [Siniperca chuatsi]|uniref:septin 4b isoform X3 n=1 Tax=Siniperca chuatsi TaxID=119488 RepID=UPI001CE1F172|nr:septin 4b isoform X3 [Siniperca chuatsi]